MFEQIKLMTVNHAHTVQKYTTEHSLIFTGVTTLVSMVFGGWTAVLTWLLIFCTLDIATGCYLSFVKNKDFTSKRLREGFGTKVMYFIVIAIGNGFDHVFFAEQPVLKTMASLFYIYVEGVSALENMANMGVPIPQKLIEGLGQIEDRVGLKAKDVNGTKDNDGDIG